ncbi:DUF1320 domain-containing protein [Moraxella nonliquefaciens]|uniref:gp436 family protein n=1 Tax=Moraxella nonliquefaciens TaxID=478 RepID=UPI0024A65282|nr:DUF1320 domain-containing protein [Moraxella nonliquefaciens]MDI4500811.1 DUF1320 domain-containing protein [Moraxella nonliquefaciens]
MITLQDLIDRFGEQEIIQLTDKVNYQVIDETVINHAISDAVAEIVGYLNPTGLIADGVYIGTPPKSLVLKVCDIARYYLYENGVTDIVEKRYRQAIDWLLLVQKNPSMLTGATHDDGTHGTKSGIAVMPNRPPNMWE